MSSEKINLQHWVGRSEAVDDHITATPCAALAATLDYPAEQPPAGFALPAMWHWLYFLPLHRQSEIGPDGHARRGGFMPPVALPRRMSAGSQLTFHAPIRVGDAVRRVSTISSIQEKDGRTGALIFVKVRHQVFCNGAVEPALTEFHDIVYRPAAQAGAAAPAPPVGPSSGQWQRTIVPDDVLLFRYSALTFNGHRIHYDRQYVSAVEGYPGLVVHGPLIATLMMDLLRRERPHAVVASFEFRAVRPLFDLHPFSVHGDIGADAQTGAAGKIVHLWAQDHECRLTMDATAVLV